MFVLTMISVSKSPATLRPRRECEFLAKQYWQACVQPRYGLMVNSPGSMRASAGTWFSAVLARTSWNVTPSNSGVRTLRT
jgi:hypothetical protein